MRNSAKLCLYGVVIAGVIGGTAAWATTDKAVAVSIDGKSETIHTRSATVGGALESAHIATNEHDAIAPAISTKVHDKSKIVIRRGRLLHLNVDGNKVDVWTTATTVDEALAALGYDSDKTISVSRGTRLPLTATQITLLTPKTITIKVDGKARTVITTAMTVRAVLVGAGVTLGATDQVSAKLSAGTSDKQVIVVKRVHILNRVAAEPIPFGTSTTNDPSALEGTTVVVTPGKAGSQQVTYRFVYVDGKLVEKRAIARKVTAQPVPKLEKVGTKKVPVVTTPSAGNTGSSGDTGSTGGSTGSSSGGPTPVGEAQTIAQQMLNARGWGGDQFGCLVSLWNRESGWNTHAANPSGAYGIPQALPGSKMSSAGPDWQNNATTQISWGLGYIAARYGNPCGAWAQSQSSGWY